MLSQMVPCVNSMQRFDSCRTTNKVSLIDISVTGFYWRITCYLK